MGSYRDLEVWQMGRDLVVLCYRLCDRMPDSEKFGLISQIQRASVSVPSNIAEGAGRKTDPAFGAFLRNALGSVFELETLLTLATDPGFLTENSTTETTQLLKRLGIKIQNLMSSLKNGGVREELSDYGQPDDYLMTT